MVIPSLIKLPDGLSSRVMGALVSSLAAKLAVSVLDYIYIVSSYNPSPPSVSSGNNGCISSMALLSSKVDIATYTKSLSCMKFFVKIATGILQNSSCHVLPTCLFVCGSYVVICIVMSCKC